MPMLASIWSARPWIVNASSSVVRSFRATATAASASTTFGRRTPNSSPPRRATVSHSRTLCESRTPTCFQQLVAARMAERVVDLLEVVEVHDHHGRGNVVAARRGKRVTDAVVEERPVGEVRERVVEGLVLVDLRLVLKRFRGTGDDPEQDAVEHGEPDEDQERVALRPVSDAGLDPRVGDRDLDSSRRPPERLQPKRNIDGQIAAGAVGEDPAAQREADVVRQRHPAVDLAPPW